MAPSNRHSPAPIASFDSALAAATRHLAEPGGADRGAGGRYRLHQSRHRRRAAGRTLLGGRPRGGAAGRTACARRRRALRRSGAWPLHRRTRPYTDERDGRRSSDRDPAADRAVQIQPRPTMCEAISGALAGFSRRNGGARSGRSKRSCSSGCTATRASWRTMGQAKTVVAELFEAFSARSVAAAAGLGAGIAAQRGRCRPRGGVVRDYIAGMTDRFALSEYAQDIPQGNCLLAAAMIWARGSAKLRSWKIRLDRAERAYGQYGAQYLRTARRHSCVRWRGRRRRCGGLAPSASDRHRAVCARRVRGVVCLAYTQGVRVAAPMCRASSRPSPARRRSRRQRRQQRGTPFKGSKSSSSPRLPMKPRIVRSRRRRQRPISADCANRRRHRSRRPSKPPAKMEAAPPTAAASQASASAAEDEAAAAQNGNAATAEPPLLWPSLDPPAAPPVVKTTPPPAPKKWPRPNPHRRLPKRRPRGGAYVLQIGAYKSEADADAAWRTYHGQACERCQRLFAGRQESRSGREGDVVPPARRIVRRQGLRRQRCAPS